MTDVLGTTVLDHCATFPTIPSPLIDRPQLLYIIETLFAAPSDIVVLDGDSGAGKTVVAAQFAKSKPNETFSVFTSGLSAASRSIDFLVGELAEQIHWHLRGTHLPDEQSATLFVRNAVLKLHKLAARKESAYYFVVDGLLELGADNPEIIETLLDDYLPTGLPTFRLLLTGPVAALPKRVSDRLRVSSHIPAPFGPDETRQYLGDLIEDPRILMDLNKTFRGVPGKLASVRRLLTSGAVPRLLADSLATSLNDLFALEWHFVKKDDDNLLLLLATVAHARHSLRLVDLAHVADLTVEQVVEKLVPLKFVIVESDQRIEYISASFKQFAADRLSHLKLEVINLILDRLFSKANVESLQIPEYLEAAGRPTDVVRYLTPEYLSSICGQLESLAPVRIAVEQGVRAARQVKDYAELIKFSLNSALIPSLNTARVLRSEVAARLKLGDRSTSLLLSQGAPLKEDRLQLLAMVARHDYQTQNPSASDLIAEIRRLSEIADFSNNPERALQVAGDLLFVSAESALKLIEAATQTPSDSRGLDIALAHLSMIAASDVNRRSKPQGLSSDDIASRIANPEFRGLVRRACMLVGSLSVEDLIRKCDELPNAADALYLLGHWTEEHSDDANAWRAIQYGLDRILKAGDYVPDARIIRMLATPLPQLASSTPFQCNQILKRIDAQRDLLRSRGPSVEYTRLILFVATAEGVWDPTLAAERVEELYYHIADLDVGTQTEALAWIVHELRGPLPTDLAAAVGSTSETVEDELLRVASILLAGTASHFEAMQGAVKALTERRLDLVKHLITLVNTEERRDALRKEAALAMVAPQRPLINAQGLAEILSSIESQAALDATLTDVLSEAAELKLSDLEPQVWQPILGRALRVRGSLRRFHACASAFALWSRQADSRNTALGDALKDAMETSFSEIDSDWDRAEAGFDAAEMLALDDRELALRYLKLSYELRCNSVFANEAALDAYARCLQLAVRAFSGLARRKIHLEEPISRLGVLVARIPSTAGRVIVWAEAAAWCFGVSANEAGTLIVDREIRPLLTHIADRRHYEIAVSRIAPALFFAHRKTASELFMELPPEVKSSSFANVCWFILTRLPLSEPFEGEAGQIFRVRYQDLVDIVECLEHVDRDSSFYSIVAAVSRSSESEIGVQLVSRDQRLEIARRIQQLMHSKLPDVKRIRHEGYVIAAEAQICRMQRASLDSWDQLRIRAAQIPNEADRCLVLNILAETVSGRYTELRDQLLAEAKASADQIPSILDRVERLESLADTSIQFASSFARKVLQEGFELTRKHPDRDARSSQLHMVDLAYRIDPEFATTLVSATDDDPARIGAQNYMKRRIELNEAKRRLARGETVQFERDGVSLQRLAEFAWMMLRALHAGRVESVRWEQGIQYVELVAQQSLEDAYPVISWLIENSIERHYQDSFGATHLPRLFDAMTFACDVAYQIFLRASGIRGGNLGQQNIASSDDPESIVIHSDERALALAFIERWLAKTMPAYLKICDAYFSAGDLEILRLIGKIVPQCQVDILTSEKQQTKSQVSHKETYREYWRVHVSDQDPPDTSVTIVGILQTKKLGIHDRWWVTNGSGLAFGGSLNGLGLHDTTRISVLSSAEASQLERDEIDPYLTWARRVVDGKRVSYNKFLLA